ncbi:MAG: chemotaxis-specific protein-glutamate methyltransferase CheB [Acidobacteriota bacterium]
MSREKIGVLVADDSDGLRNVMVHVMERDHEIEVKGIARNGEEAIQQTLKLKPDVITMDLMMPKIDGLEATRQIMALRPTPIVVVTSLDDSQKSFEAIRAGALEVLCKPQAIHTPDGMKCLSLIVRIAKMMADVKVISHKPNKSLSTPQIRPITREHATAAKIVAIASSTGGPPVLHQILKRVGSNFSVPILIVQHISPGFGQGLVEWLDATIEAKVVKAQEGELPLPGKIYIAPDNYHLLIDRNGKIRLSSGLPVKGHRPSANLMFESVAQYYGPTALGIILTGMGDDGIQGLKMLKQEQGFCIAQDEASSIIFGMPKAAIENGLADLVMNPDEIAAYLQNLANRSIN